MKELAGPDLPLSASTQEDGEISDTCTHHGIETQTQSHKIHQVHQHSMVHQFPIDYIEPGGHPD